MLVGYVSDEFYVGIPNVGIEFTREGISVAIRSRTSGSVYANVEPGAYRVYLSREGFTPKWVDMEVRAGVIHHFRLLSDNISGYVWPKWVRSGDTGQVRLHSPRDAVVSLWRYGWEREFVTELGHLTDEPRGAYCQILPDGDVSRTGVRWSDHGYSYPEVDPLSGGGPESLYRGVATIGVVLLPRQRRSRVLLLVPPDRGPSGTRPADRGVGLQHQLERLQPLRGPEQLRGMRSLSGPSASRIAVRMSTSRPTSSPNGPHPNLAAW